MKKVIMLVLTAAMLLSLCACGGKSISSETGIPVPQLPAAAESEAPAPALPAKEVLYSGTWTEDDGSCTIEFLGAELFSDDDDEQALRVWFDFTNNTTETLRAWDYLSFDMSVQQGGQSLPQAFCPTDAEIDEEFNKKMNIRPGTVIRCVDQKKVSLEGGNVTVILSADSELSWELDLNNLPGAPKEPLTLTPVSNPGWTDSLPLEGVYEDDYYIRIASAEVSKDGNGNRALRVTYEFTNNAAEEKSMWHVTEFWAYQDGIGGDIVWPSYADSTETDENFQDYLAPGETWMASNMFRLYTDSPLEVEIVDSKGGTGLGAVFYVTADDTVTIGDKAAEPVEEPEATPAPVEIPTERPEKPAAPAAPVLPSDLTQSFTITDNDSTTVTVHYPVSFSYEADYRKGSFLSHTPYVYGGVLKGANYTVDFAFVKANNYYKTVEAYVKTFKGTDIYEEIQVDGFKAYVRQDKTSRLNIVIWLTETQMLNVEVTVPGEGSEAVYRPIWEGDTVPAIINNLEITVAAVVGETVSTDYGYVSLTELDGWKKGEPKANFNLTMYNSGLGYAVWVDVQDLQLGTLQQTKDIIKSGFPNAVWTETVVAGYTLSYLDCGSFKYLAGETTTGKPFSIELAGCDLDTAASLLETLVIK